MLLIDKNILNKRFELINMIKLKRKILNYSQKDVGNKIDTPQQSISLIEKYERCPSLDTFIK